jgi:L-alanine-DL-glutamate epimerase-like enolase superfamily enzyme
MRFSRHQPAALAATGPVRLTRVEIWVCRAPVETPVETSFGVMHSRPALFVRIEESEGAFGFGEVW